MISSAESAKFCSSYSGPRDATAENSNTHNPSSTSISEDKSGEGCDTLICQCDYDNDLLIGARVNGVAPAVNISSCIRIKSEVDEQSGNTNTFCSVYLRVPREREVRKSTFYI